MKIKKKIIPLFIFVIAAPSVLILYKSRKLTQNLSETKFASTPGSYQKVVKIKHHPQIESQMIDSKVNSPNKKLMSRGVNSQIVDHLKKERDELQQIIDQSRDKIVSSSDIYVFDYILSFSRIDGRESIGSIQGKNLYEKDLNDESFGLAIKDGKIGSITGEIIFKTKEIDLLIRSLNNVKAEVIYSDKKSEFVIVRSKSTNFLKSILTSDEFKKFNPRPDILFEMKKAI
jgi:hypothetical protein